MPCPITSIAAADAAFPAALRGIRASIDRLWWRGRLPTAEQPLVAMVGSRAATLAGCRRATELASALSARGFGVISGGALGIDAAAHRGALDGGGSTYAVLGCGVDVVYPDRHGPLFDEIMVTGGLLSHYPPGTPPRRRQFPTRNELVVALARAVVVVEARLRSGALITARLARELGRPLYAVPGSAGTDGLIAAGAAVAVEGAPALLAQLAGAAPVAAAPPSALAALIDVLRDGPAAPLQLARRLDVPLSEVLGRLVQAELAGWARRLPGGRFEVPRAH